MPDIVSITVINPPAAITAVEIQTPGPKGDPGEQGPAGTTTISMTITNGIAAITVGDLTVYTPASETDPNA